MIELNLQPHITKNYYRQEFANGFVGFVLSKTSTSKVFNRCRVEIGFDPDRRGHYHFWNCKVFSTEEAFERGKIWALEILNKYEAQFISK